MERYFVLTYVQNERPEHWIRTSACDAVECLDNWMFDDDNEILFTIHMFDVEGQINILTDIDFKKIDAEDLIEEASKIDEQYPSTAVMPDGDILICKQCCVFTTKRNCKFCERETSDIEI